MRALVMGDHDLDLLHVGHCEMTFGGADGAGLLLGVDGRAYVAGRLQ